MFKVLESTYHAHHRDGEFVSLCTCISPILSQDGRCPFTPEEEAAVLMVLRKREQWPCFPPNLAYIGARYRSLGYHERQQAKDLTQPTKQDGAVSTVYDDIHNVNQMLRLLCQNDALFVANFSTRVADNYKSVDLSVEDQVEIGEIIRYTVLGRTSQCKKSAPRSMAHELCLKYSDASPETTVMVCDMTARDSSQRVLAQNQASVRLIGNMQGNGFGAMVTKSNLFRLLVAIVGAFHRPGESLTITKQQVMCGEYGLQLFNLAFVVDPESFFLVVYGGKS